MDGSRAEEKRRLRRALLARRREVPAEQARAAAEAAAEHLAATPEFAAARRVVLYAALPGELPTAPLLERCRRSGKRVLWPRMGLQGALEFAPADDPSVLVPGAFGVLEPPAHHPSEVPGGDTLLVVPGVAFDRAGRRLGRGLGVFDRALAAFGPSGEGRGPRCFGLGYAFQLVERVPEDPWDRRMDAVVTEAGVHRPEEAAA